MKYAIIEMCGRQFWFELDKFYDLNYLTLIPGQKIFLNQILYVNDDGKLYLGDPFLKNVQVRADILNHLRGSKLIVYKMKSKKKFRRKQGHRQNLTRILIDGVLTI